MADSDALRARRKRAHAAGDHSLCKRCAVVRADPGVVGTAKPVADADAGLRLLAGQLAAAYEADRGNALLARELRMTLQALLPSKGGLDGELAEFLAGFSQA